MVTQIENELRSVIRPMRAKSTFIPLAIFTLDVSVYAAATWYAITATHPISGLVFGTLAGIAIAMLFIVGHDACHGSFTASRRWNSWIGRAAFLPSLTPFHAWEVRHNQTHHVYTSLKPLDCVWAPFSKQEFDALPRWRQWMERGYRTPLGVGLYYGIEIWGKRLFFARVDPQGVMLCSAYALLLAVAALLFGLPSLLAGVLWPFAVWNWLMGWAIFEHHTHPRAPWFDDEREWRAARAQTRCTVHVVLPRPFDIVLHRIMQHTAHHLDVTIPLYRLADAQTALEAGQREEIITYQWTPLTFVRHMRVCKLYDFKRREWVGFDGRPVDCLPHISTGELRRESPGPARVRSLSDRQSRGGGPASC